MTHVDIKAAVAAEPTVAKRVVRLLTTVANNIEHAAACGELEQELAVLRANIDAIASEIPDKPADNPPQAKPAPKPQPQPAHEQKERPQVHRTRDPEEHISMHKRKR